jgi:hypothetical protein
MSGRTAPIWVTPAQQQAYLSDLTAICERLTPLELDALVDGTHELDFSNGLELGVRKGTPDELDRVIAARVLTKRFGG